MDYQKYHFKGAETLQVSHDGAIRRAHTMNHVVFTPKKKGSSTTMSKSNLESQCFKDLQTLMDLSERISELRNRRSGS